MITAVLPESEADYISYQYCLALFWAVTTSMGFEPPIAPSGPLEQLYVVLVVIFGVMVTSFVVGSATSIVASMDAISSKRKQELRLCLSSRRAAWSASRWSLSATA